MRLTEPALAKCSVKQDLNYSLFHDYGSYLKLKDYIMIRCEKIFSMLKVDKIGNSFTKLEGLRDSML